METTKYKAFHIHDAPNNAFEYDAPTALIAAHVLDALSDYDLFLQKEGYIEDFNNVGGLLMLNEDGEWEEMIDSFEDILEGL